MHQNILFAGQELVSLAVPFCFIFFQTAFSELLYEFIVDFLSYLAPNIAEVKGGPKYSVTNAEITAHSALTGS